MRIRIIRGVSFLSLIPMLAPVAGFIAGMYAAYDGLEKYDRSKSIFLNILPVIIKPLSLVVGGVVFGIIGMFLPPGLSAMPVGAFMGFSKAGIELSHDRKTTGKPIGFMGGLKRVVGALLGAIPLLGPTFSDRALKKISQDFKNSKNSNNAHPAQNAPPPAAAPAGPAPHAHHQHVTPPATPTPTVPNRRRNWLGIFR